jgi:hypothetical protein
METVKKTEMNLTHKMLQRQSCLLCREFLLYTPLTQHESNRVKMKAHLCRFYVSLARFVLTGLDPMSIALHNIMSLTGTDA